MSDVFINSILQIQIPSFSEKAVKIADKNFPAIVLAYEAILPSQLIDLIMKKSLLWIQSNMF